MSFAVSAIVTGVAVAGATAYAGYAQSEAQKQAGEAMGEASDASINFQKQQFAKIQEIMQPYLQAGTQALTQQQNISGVNGPEAQQAAYDQVMQSPAYQALQKSGSDAILANASATGGIRGGNTQGALAQFGTANLANAIDRQYGQYAGLTQLGANAGANLAGQSGVMSQSIGNQIYQGGMNQANAQLGSASTMANLIPNALMGGIGAGTGFYSAFGPTPAKAAT